MKNNIIRLSETKDMVNITLLVTSKCTLRCKLCATYAPYQKNPIHYSYDTLTKSVERFFKCIKKPVGIVSISGGEPLLHPQLSELLNFFNEHSDKFKMIEIATNGTIIPDSKLLTSMKAFDKLNILLDNYGEKLSTKASEIQKVFECNSIPYRLRNYTAEESWCGGWIDISDFSEKGRTDTDMAEIYGKCGFNSMYSNIYFLINGVAHNCYATKQLLDFVEETVDESVSLINPDMTDEEVHNGLTNLRKRDFKHACKNCSGFLFDSEHKIAAEQL